MAAPKHPPVQLSNTPSGGICAMRKKSFAVFPLVVAVSLSAAAQPPDGFRWVDFKRDTAIVATVAKTLGAENYTAIREIGISGDFALVFTVSREPEQATPEGDQWLVSSISLKSGEKRDLIAGYQMEIKDWVRFEDRGLPDLGVIYLECWECEPISLFGPIHYDPKEGWRARWKPKRDTLLAGIQVRDDGVGDPYTDDDVDQIFAVFQPDKGAASAGTWYRSRSLKTGKVSSYITKYFVDQNTGAEQTVELHGAEAATFEIKLCKAQDASPGLLDGQSSSSCKRVLNKTKH